jgi:hypothetical protein
MTPTRVLSFWILVPCIVFPQAVSVTMAEMAANRKKLLNILILMKFFWPGCQL